MAEPLSWEEIVELTTRHVANRSEEFEFELDGLGTDRKTVRIDHALYRPGSVSVAVKYQISNGAWYSTSLREEDIVTKRYVAW